jgi:Right handed beta helix region
MLVSPRTTNVLLVVMIAIGIAIVAMLANGAFAGPLDPPAAPGPTDGVREAGTPISSIPFTITQPGRYYLTRNLTSAAGINAVTIQASNVTLDLHGFTLQGPGSSGDGVLVSGAQSGIRVENGTVVGWFNGVDAQTATSMMASGLIVLGNGFAVNDGSYGFISGTNSILEDCLVRDNKNTGVLLKEGSVIRRCSIVDQAGIGVLATGDGLVEDNWFEFNGDSISGGGLSIQGYAVDVHGNTFHEARDIVFAFQFYAGIYDNELFACNSIISLPAKEMAPRDGSEHSNYVEAIGSC